MNATIKTIGVFCIMILVQTAQAQVFKNTTYPIDKYLEDCLAHTEGQTVGGCVGCMRVAREKWEADVDRKYQEMILTASDREKQLFKSMHNSWLKYKEQHFKFLDETYGHRTGTWLVIVEEEKMKVVKHYALRIKDMLDAVPICRLDDTAN